MAYTQVRPGKPLKPKRPRRKLVKDPLAPLSDTALRSQALGLSNQESSAALGAASSAIERRSQAGTNAITGYTSALSQDLGKYADRAKAAYGQAAASQGANATALRGALAGAGQSLSSELGGKLAAINAPAAAQTQVAGGAAQMGAGAANAGLAESTAGLDNLAAQGGSAQAYASALPGIAALQGGQSIKELQAQLTSELATAAGQITSQAAQTFTSIYTHLLDQELNKALARQSGQFKNAQAQADAEYKAQMMAYRKATLIYKQSNDAANRSARVTTANKNRAATNARAKQTQANQNRRQNKWQTNPDGSFKYRLNKKTGKRERIPLKKSSSGGANDGL